MLATTETGHLANAGEDPSGPIYRRGQRGFIPGRHTSRVAPSRKIFSVARRPRRKGSAY
jgi:hypothetical protein